MTAWLADPGYRSARTHATIVTLAAFGLDPGRTKKQFAVYRKRFGFE